MQHGRSKILIILSIPMAILIMAICIYYGSVSAADTSAALYDSIIWKMRIPRVLAAFLAGGALCVCGAVMQSVLENPLASSYTLGVSSGASLGAAIVIITGISSPVLKALMLPAAGFVFGLLTVGTVMAIAAAFDRNLQSRTIILIGVIVSMFMNSVLTLLASLFHEHAQELYLWMNGSFSSRGWQAVWIMAAACIVIVPIICRYSTELDILSFGDEQSQAMGVDTGRVRRILMILTTLLTGICVSLVGVIGFADLVIPHAVRRIFGVPNRRVLPLSFIFGGSFMMLADLAARTVIAPREIPVGAITALMGAPFFIYVCIAGRRRG